MIIKKFSMIYYRYYLLEMWSEIAKRNSVPSVKKQMELQTVGEVRKVRATDAVSVQDPLPIPVEPIVLTHGAGFGTVHMDRVGKAAIIHFLEHATYRLVSFGGVSCITLVATLPPDIPSYCFTHIRPDEPDFSAPIRSLLIKVMMKSSHAVKQKFKHDRLLGGKEIEVQTNASFLSEIHTQQEIFTTSMGMQSEDFPNLLDALCPQIIWSATITEAHREHYYTLFCNGIADKRTRKDLQLFFTNPYQTSIICMEYLEGYNTVDHYRKNGLHPDDLSEPLAYELMRLALCGYIHTDLHFENMMYHPDIVDHYKKGGRGKLQLIDFGRVQRISDYCHLHKIEFPREKTIQDYFTLVSSLKVYTIHMMRYPDLDEVERIILYRKTMVDVRDAILAYGRRYETEISQSGRDPNRISAIVDFIRSAYIEVIHRNSNGRLGISQSKKHTFRKNKSRKNKNNNNSKKNSK